MTLPAPSSEQHTWAVRIAQYDINRLLGITGPLTTTTTDTSRVRILHHFHTVTCSTLGGDIVNRTVRSVVETTAGAKPYLMHVVLAMGLAHLRRLAPLSGPRATQRRLVGAETFHWHAALQAYRSRLAADGAFKDDFDSMVATTFLTILYTFALDDDIAVDALGTNATAAWTHALEPLAAASGFRALNCVNTMNMPGSVWTPVVSETDNEDHTFTSKAPGIDSLPAAFIDLCDLSPESTEANNPYHSIVRHLTPLLALKPGLANMTTLFAFVGRTWRVLRPLLLQRDCRALLLVSWWLALLHQVDQWWVATRARSECAALVAFLSASSNPKIQALLVYPASFGVADYAWIWQPQR